ncbi:hypothetical protein CR513_25396, partial [Mucuna pruriens]
MIEDAPIGRQGQIAEALPSQYLLKITNNEFLLSGNTILMCEDPSQLDKPVEDEGTEAEALVEMKRWLEQERPKFQPLAEDFKGINLGNEIERREVRVGKQMPPYLRCLCLVLSKHAWLGPRDCGTQITLAPGPTTIKKNEAGGSLKDKGGGGKAMECRVPSRGELPATGGKYSTGA